MFDIFLNLNIFFVFVSIFIPEIFRGAKSFVLPLIFMICQYFNNKKC
jgi:hypothetical protein